MFFSVGFLFNVYSETALLAIFDAWRGLCLSFRKILVEYFVAELCDSRGIMKIDRIASLASCFSSAPSLHAELGAQQQSSAPHIPLVCFPHVLSSSEVEKRGNNVLPVPRCFPARRVFLSQLCSLLSHANLQV